LRRSPAEVLPLRGSVWISKLTFCPRPGCPCRRVRRPRCARTHRGPSVLHDESEAPFSVEKLYSTCSHVALLRCANASCSPPNHSNGSQIQVWRVMGEDPGGHSQAGKNRERQRYWSAQRICNHVLPIHRSHKPDTPKSMKTDSEKAGIRKAYRIRSGHRRLWLGRRWLRDGCAPAQWREEHTHSILML